jgi:hypothetical protein
MKDGDQLSKSMSFNSQNEKFKGRGNILLATLAPEDRKSPERMLLKLTDKINQLERIELTNIESQNLNLGTDLNQITFQMYNSFSI